MEEKKCFFGSGKLEVFLICDNNLVQHESPFLDWLRSEEFRCGDHKGSYGCPWIYVDLTRMQYAYGMPGIGKAGVIGNHAITVEEFKTIYAIYKKYEGKDLFVFHSERFDCVE